MFYSWVYKKNVLNNFKPSNLSILLRYPAKSVFHETDQYFTRILYREVWIPLSTVRHAVFVQQNKKVFSIEFKNKVL